MKTLLTLVLFAGAARAQSGDIVRFPVCLKGAEGEIVFTAERSAVLEAGNGYFVTGALQLETPIATMPLLQAEAYFEKDPGATCMHTARGRAVPPTPIAAAPLVSNTPSAEFGVDIGVRLQTEFGIGLIEKRQYLFFKLDAGFDIQSALDAEEDDPENPQSFEMSAGPNSNAKLLLDPFDPFYYVSGSVITPKKQQKQEPQEEEPKLLELGTGASWQGLIPFKPTTTFGIENKAREFFGHRIKSGVFELVKLPLRINGYMVENINPLGHEKPAVDLFGIGYGPEAQMGANGTFHLSFKLLKSDSLKFLRGLEDIRLGTASAAFEVVRDAQYAYISGVFTPKSGNTLSKFIRIDGELKAMAFLSTKIEDTALAMNGRFDIVPGEFSQLTGISLNNFMHGEGSLSADRNGLFVRMLLENGSSLGPLSYRGRVQAEMAIPSEQPENSYIQIEGETAFSGVSAIGITRVSRRGLDLTGRIPNPGIELTAAFRPDPAGVLVEGTASAPALMNPQITEAITNAAEQVQNDLDKLLKDLQQATKDLEFEVSLRGLRPVIAAACDAVLRAIDTSLRPAFNAAWPKIWVPFQFVDAPGKEQVWGIVNDRADDYRGYIRNLRSTVLRADDATTRAALRSAINLILTNRRLTIAIQIPVVNERITFFDRELINSTVASQLTTARSAIDRIPAVSNVKVSAQRVWDAAPKRAVLLDTAKQLRSGTATVLPRIESLRFQTRPAVVQWTFAAVVSVAGQRRNFTLTMPISQLSNLGRLLGAELAKIL